MSDSFLLNRSALQVYSELDLMIASVTRTGLSVHHPHCLLPQFATAGQIPLPANTAAASGLFVRAVDTQRSTRVEWGT